MTVVLLTNMTSKVQSQESCKSVQTLIQKVWDGKMEKDWRNISSCYAAVRHFRDISAFGAKSFNEFEYHKNESV